MNKSMICKFADRYNGRNSIKVLIAIITMMVIITIPVSAQLIVTDPAATAALVAAGIRDVKKVADDAVRFLKEIELFAKQTETLVTMIQSGDANIFEIADQALATTSTVRSSIATEIIQTSVDSDRITSGDATAEDIAESRKNTNESFRLLKNLTSNAGARTRSIEKAIGGITTTDSPLAVAQYSSHILGAVASSVDDLGLLLAFQNQTTLREREENEAFRLLELQKLEFDIEDIEKIIPPGLSAAEYRKRFYDQDKRYRDIR